MKKILQNLDMTADYISLREVKTKSISLSVRNEIFENLESREDHGVMIEVMMNGQFAYSGTQSFDPDEILRCARQAKEEALRGSEFSLAKFSLEERPGLKGEYQSPGAKMREPFCLKESTQFLMELSAKMRASEKVISRNVFLELNEMETHFVSTNGADIKQNIFRTTLSGSATASSEKGNQRRSFGDEQTFQFGMGKLDKEELLTKAQRVGEEALLLLDAEECPSETMDVILAPDQLYLQIHESIGHPLELDRILGDERNYAGWSFVKPSDFGSLRYGPPIMNVTFDPTLEGENASYCFDDTGASAQKEFLIKDGLLVRGLGSLESQRRLNLLGVASQRAISWNRAPIDRMGNINLEAGKSSFLDMIKSVKRGVFMQTNRSWSIDDYRNKFQFGCECAHLIEDGKLTKLLKNPNYRGITAQFWNQLKMVGDKSTFRVGGISHCGKGEPNQIIFVGHASPACLFGNVEVFGGGIK